MPAEGADDAQVFFVGEAPGPDEDRLGRPFVGRAGRLLRECLEEAGFDGSQVWITNIVKRFPYDEVEGKRRIRRPTPREVAACLPHLAREVTAVRPRLLVALGRTAAEGLTGEKLGGLGKIRRHVVPACNEIPQARVFVTHHPSALFYGALRGQRSAFVDDLRASLAHIAEGPSCHP